MPSDPIKILLTGDFCPINRMEKLAIGENYDQVFNDFTNVFTGNDLNVVDLECPLTISENARLKTGPHQKAHPAGIKLLKHINVGLVAMANNHVMDFGLQGIQDTLELCSSNRINTVGVGKDSEDASRPFTTTLKNRKIAILNYADNEFLTITDGSYSCNPFDHVQAYYDILKLRKEHDFLVVIMHAGNEFYELPSPRTKRLYRYLVDLGVDAVISHHTHAFSGYEIYHDKPIFYGLGNFLYDWPGKRTSSWNRGFAVKLLLSEKIGFEVIPLKQNDHEAGVFHLNEEDIKAFNNDLENLNRIIQDDQRLEEEFQKYCKSVYPMYDAFIEPNFGRYVTALRKRGFFPRLLTRRKRLFLLNLTRCESHRDVLIRMLKQNE